MNPEFELIVYGATSFVGRILCVYLDQECPDLRWAIAGRSREKLLALRSSLRCSDLPMLIANAENAEALEAMCRRTRVVLSTVGPYALYGDALVKACVDSGTDYCDLAGEVQWIRRMIIAHQAAATRSGARIVHCCGFDSIPSDLGVWFLQQNAINRFGEPCTSVRMRVEKMKGGASGGTIASMINVVRETAGNPDLRTELADPYSLCPTDHRLKARQHAVGVEYDEDLQSWVAPFIMAGINTRVVHRSNALLNCAWGGDFCYDEGMLTGQGKKGERRARRLARGLKLFMLGASLAPTRWLILKFLPKPGEGPGPQAREKGFFDLSFTGTTRNGRTVRTRVHGDRDPGYGASARMLAQAGLCLARDVPKDTVSGGFWTPSTIFGQRLLGRLERDAGLQFQVP